VLLCHLPPEELRKQAMSGSQHAITKLRPAPRSSGAPRDVPEQSHREQDYKQKKQNSCDARGRESDTGETKHRRQQRDNEKAQGPAQHHPPSGASRIKCQQIETGFGWAMMEALKGCCQRGSFDAIQRNAYFQKADKAEKMQEKAVV
jgi:hypothetical protein